MSVIVRDQTLWSVHFHRGLSGLSWTFADQSGGDWMRHARGQAAQSETIFHPMSLVELVFEVDRSLNVVLVVVIGLDLLILSHSIGAPTGNQLGEIQWESRDGDSTLLLEANGAGVNHTRLFA